MKADKGVNPYTIFVAASFFFLGTIHSECKALGGVKTSVFKWHYFVSFTVSMTEWSAESVNVAPNDWILCERLGP